MIINLQAAEIVYGKSLTDSKCPFRIFDTKCLSIDPNAMSLQAPKRIFYNLPQPQNYRPDVKHHKNAEK